MQRIMISGGPGSGKSTLGIKLAVKTGLPLYHMDHIHYRPGWDARSVEEKDQMAHEVHMREQWIFEGGHMRTYAERIERADTIIWLDIPFWLRLWRCFWRSIVYRGRTRPDMQENCPERLNPEFFLSFGEREKQAERI